MARVTFSDLPVEMLTQIYEQVIVDRRILYAETNGDFNGIMPTRPWRDTSDIRALLQVHSTSREVALRHISRNSGPTTQRLTLDARHFNRAVDVVSIREIRNGDFPGATMTSRAAASLVLGAEIPSVVLHVFDIVRNRAHLTPTANPVTVSMQYLTDVRHTNPRFAQVFGQLATPQLPRNLYLLVGMAYAIPSTTAGGPFTLDRRTRLTLEEMTIEVAKPTFYITEFSQVREFLTLWAGWSQIPGLALPNISFLRFSTMDGWVSMGGGLRRGG